MKSFSYFSKLYSYVKLSISREESIYNLMHENKYMAKFSDE